MDTKANNEIEGLRQGPTKDKGQQLKPNHMASVLMKLFPDFCLPQKHSYLRDDKNLLVKTKSGHRVQPDFILLNQKIIVEVDGQSQNVGHYTKTKICIDDMEKDEVYEKLGWNVIRIPAYVQLDEETVKFYFGMDYREELYPACHLHGFLHDKIALPTDFCDLGLERFYKEMESLPVGVKSKILDTLRERVIRFQEKGYDYQTAKMLVVPENFKYDI